MLDKLVIHLKNIIFFKSIIYLICATLLIMLIPIFQEELLKSNYKKEKAQEFLVQAQMSLNSITSLEAKIVETNKNFKYLMANSGKQGCRDRMDLLQNLESISKKYNLSEPISSEISRLFDLGYPGSKASDVKFRDYQIVVNFAVNTTQEILEIVEEICDILPAGAFVTSTEVKKIDTLTPEIINKFPSKGIPGLIDVSMKILTREIVYEK